MQVLSGLFQRVCPIRTVVYKCRFYKVIFQRVCPIRTMVYKCRFYQVYFRGCILLEQWSINAGSIRLYFRGCVLLEQWSLNSLPNNKFLDMTKLKAFADHRLNVAVMMISFFDRLENTVGKEKILETSIFSFSLTVFQSLIY